MLQVLKACTLKYVQQTHHLPFGFYVFEEEGYKVENKQWKLNENFTQKEGLLNKIYLRGIH